MAQAIRFIRHAVLAVVVLVAPNAIAQDINNPTHMPNSVMNKVVHYRLLGLTSKMRAEKAQKNRRGEALDEVRDEMGDDQGTNINQMIPGGGGCSVDIGNVGSTGLTGSADRDVVVVGDVINVCQ